MEVQVAIVSCKNCVFTQNAESIVLGSLDSINKEDVGNISLKVISFDLPELNHTSVAVTIRKARVQIIIITHAFLDQLKNSGKKNCQFFLKRVLHSNGVICVLMRIDSQEVLRNYSNLLPHFLDWNILELRANREFDSKFSNKFRDHVIQSYNDRARHFEPKIHRLNTSFLHFNINSVHHNSSTAPPPSPEVDFGQIKSLLLSTTSDEGSETITIKLNQPVGPSDELRIQLRKGDEIFSTVVQIPDNLLPVSSCGSIVKIEAPFVLVSDIFPNDDDPIDQMILKFPGYKQYLDHHLSQALEQVGSPVDHLTLLQEFRNGRDDLLPTVLHFAAYYDLKETVVTLMEKEDGVKSFSVTNAHGDTPLDIALRRGYNPTIGQILCSYEGIINTYEQFRCVTYLKDSATSSGIRNAFFEDGTPFEKSEIPKPIDEVVIEESDGTNNSTPQEDYSSDGYPQDTIYTNIEVIPIIPPKLPKRKQADVIGNYCVPPVAVPVSSTNKLGSFPITHENYIDLYEKGKTLEWFNKNFIRASSLSAHSSSDEDDSPVIYDRPPPPPPTVSDEVPKQKPILLDHLEEELVDLLKQAVTKDIKWEEVLRMFQTYKESGLMRASEEQRVRDIESFRVEYHETQQKNKNTVGFLDRMVNGIKNARKKISVSAKTNGMSPTAENSQSVSTPPPNVEFMYPTVTSSLPMIPVSRRRSSSLSTVFEIGKEKPTNRLKSSSGFWGNAMETKFLDVSYVVPSPTDQPNCSTTSKNHCNQVEMSQDYLVLEPRVVATIPKLSTNKEPTLLDSTDGPITSKSDENDSFDTSVDTSTVEQSNTEKLLITSQEPTPPPRPPKKITPPQRKLATVDIPLVTYEHPCIHSDTISDEERRKLVPPKPTRRNIKNLHYINYNDVEASNQQKKDDTKIGGV